LTYFRIIFHPLSEAPEGAALAMPDTAFSNLVTVTGYLSIYDNVELASLSAAFSSLSTVTG